MTHFRLISDDHRLIAEAVQRRFEDLGKLDLGQRQAGGNRLPAAAIEAALIELGLIGPEVGDELMVSAQVQAAVAVEAGATGLAFPVLESMLAQSMLWPDAARRRATGEPAVSALSTQDVPLEQLPELRDARLIGTVPLVAFAERADLIVCAARRDREVVLVHVLAREPGVALSARSSVEVDYPLHDVQLDGARVDRVDDRLDDSRRVGAAMLQRGSLLAAAEIAGACRRMIRMTRDYLVARIQFGQPLGANQSLKHALADAHTRVEAMTAAVEYAAGALDAGSDDAEEAVWAAKHFATRAGKSVADTTLQLHGAIGYTVDFPLHLFMRRVYRLGASFGSAQVQGARLFRIFQRATA